MYVMTPEYGAATQLEKINMLDYADLICLNKFDKAGALDALSCRCPQERRPPCPHRLALFAVERAQRVAGPAPGAAERLRARARQQALQVALAAIGEAPDPAAVRRALAVAHGQLVEVAALR